MVFALTPRWRKVVLTTHIIFSVGWLGAVAVFVAHAIVGLASADKQIIAVAYIAMWLSCWLVIIPASISSFFTGLIQALFTPWGLFKHWWIVIKFILTAGCTILLFLHTSQISYLAQTAADSALSNPQLYDLRAEIMIKAAAAVIVLAGITVISVYKPWGLTPYGLQKSGEKNHGKQLTTKTKTLLYVLLLLLVLTMLFFIHRHFGGNIHH